MGFNKRKSWKRICWILGFLLSPFKCFPTLCSKNHEVSLVNQENGMHWAMSKNTKKPCFLVPSILLYVRVLAQYIRLRQAEAVVHTNRQPTLYNFLLNCPRCKSNLGHSSGTPSPTDAGFRQSYKRTVHYILKMSEGVASKNENCHRLYLWTMRFIKQCMFFVCCCSEFILIK